MHMLTPVELALSGLAGFGVAMLIARPAQLRLYRSLRRAEWTLRTLPELCAWALYVDAERPFNDARLARYRYAAMIEGAA